MKRFYVLTVLAVLSFGLLGCSNDSDSPVLPNLVSQQIVVSPSTALKPDGTPVSPGYTTTSVATDFDVSLPEEVYLGSAGVVNIKVTPADADFYVKYDADAIIFLTTPFSNGKDGYYDLAFVGIKNGSGSFTIESTDGKVSQKKTVRFFTKLTSLSITGASKLIDKGSTLQLTAVQNLGADEIISWGSSDTDIATVDSNGLVTAVSPGVVTIVATGGKETSGTEKSGLVSAYYEVTVKGFYLDDDLFVLFNKKTDGIDVEAFTYGVEGNVSWTAGKTTGGDTIFTVTPNTSDSKKAKINYVQGKAGEAELIATCGNQTAKAKVVVSQYSMLALGDSIAAGYAPKASLVDSKSMEEPEMIAAYEQYVRRRSGGTKGENYVNEYCYSAVLYNHAKTDRNIVLNSFAKTGDRTDDLLAKLDKDYANKAEGIKKGEILEAVRDADFITLCIGANDFLQNAKSEFIIAAGDGKDNEFLTVKYPEILENCYSSFKKNFDTIIDTLVGNGARVYVMSVYSPYKAFNDKMISSEEMNTYAKAGLTANIYTTGLLRLNTDTMKYLDKLNEYIKTKANGNANVFFVDVATAMNAIPNTDYSKYLHADPTKFSLSKLRNAALLSSIPIWFDPHPTILGEKTIGELFQTVFDNSMIVN